MWYTQFVFTRFFDPLVKCELRKIEWVYCELKCELARDWSDIFRPTRSLPGATAFSHSWHFLRDDYIQRVHRTINSGTSVFVTQFIDAINRQP